MVAFAADYAPTTEAPDAQNRARGIFLAVEVRAGENGVESRRPRREKVAFSYETASGPTNFLNRDPIGEQGGLNLYAFVGNDPVNGIDFLGLKRLSSWISWDVYHIPMRVRQSLYHKRVDERLLENQKQLVSGVSLALRAESYNDSQRLRDINLSLRETRHGKDSFNYETFFKMEGDEATTSNTGSAFRSPHCVECVKTTVVVHVYTGNPRLNPRPQAMNYYERRKRFKIPRFPDTEHAGKALLILCADGMKHADFLGEYTVRRLISITERTGVAYWGISRAENIVK